MERDYKGVTDELQEVEGDLMQISDEKLVSEAKNKKQLDTDSVEIQSLRDQIEDLKSQLADKETREYELQDELMRANRTLDDTDATAQRLTDKVAKETVKVNDLQTLVDSND